MALEQMKKSVLEVEYDTTEKPLTDFPRKLTTYLAKRFDLSGKMIDIACGRGEHSQGFHELGLDVWAVDMSKAAASEYDRKDERFKSWEIGKEPAPFEDNTFDVVFCKSLIEHVDAEELLNEMARILKPGGAVIILTLDWWYDFRMWYIDHTHGYGVPWMKHSLRNIMLAFGFENLEVENMYYLEWTWNNPFGRWVCRFIRLFPYVYTDNFTNPLWKIYRFSNEVQLLGYGRLGKGEL